MHVTLAFCSTSTWILRSTSPYAHLRRIATIRRMLTNQAAEQLIHAFITSRLDFCNSLLCGLSQNTLHRLQLVQNAAARLLTGHKKSAHITPILHRLHWLPIQFRIQYKIILLTFKAHHCSAPIYLQTLLQFRNVRPGLRSSDKLLSVPRSRLVSYGDRAFSNIAPRLWNRLPVDLRETENITLFTQRLKTYLFMLAFPVNWCSFFLFSNIQTGAFEWLQIKCAL